MKKFDLKKAILKNKATFFGSLTEGYMGQFYAPEYLEQKYGKEMASKIEAEIDEMDPNSWDRFTGMESAKEVDEYIADIVSMLKEGYMGQFYAPEYLEKKYGKKMASKIEAEIDEMDPNSWDRFTGMESAEEVEDYIVDIVDMLKISEGYDEFKRVEKGKKKTVAKDKGEEEVYGAGVKKGEEIEKKKMTKEELKAKIKKMVLAEMALDIDNMEDAPESEVDFLAELEGMLNETEGLTKLQQYIYNYETDVSGEDFADKELENIKKLNTPEDVYTYYAETRGWEGSMDDDLENIYRQVKRKFKNLGEAKDEEEVEDEVDVDIESPEPMDEPTSGISVTQNANADLTGTEKELQDNLEAALEAAKKIGDDKLQQQIGNSLTFFTRQHVVKEGDVAEGEEIKEGMGGDDVEDLAFALEYETTDEFFRDNPGAVDALFSWATSIPEFRQKMMDNGLLEGKKEDLNESMFPMLKKIIK